MQGYSMKNRSPSGNNQRPDTSIHQKGMHNRSPSAVEPHPKGKSVNEGATRSTTGAGGQDRGPGSRVA